MGTPRKTPEELRFAFGANWRRYTKLVDVSRIQAAKNSLTQWYGTDLQGKSFLDVGCGSGLSSLAARRLGADVRSFDYDQDSVTATTSLKDRYLPGDDAWVIEQGSILDTNYIASLGKFDCVYSWGVLHHTGDLWAALESVSTLVKPGGLLWIAVYDDQGSRSKRWLVVKKLYNRSPGPGKALIVALSFARLWGPTTIRDLLSGHPFATWHSSGRGMDPWHDVIDWVGGYPFEVAKVDSLFEFFAERGFELERMRAGSNNELLLRAPQAEPA